jgi:hypothetical protein
MTVPVLAFVTGYTFVAHATKICKDADQNVETSCWTNRNSSIRVARHTDPVAIFDFVVSTCALLRLRSSNAKPWLLCDVLFHELFINAPDTIRWTTVTGLATNPNGILLSGDDEVLCTTLVNAHLAPNAKRRETTRVNEDRRVVLNVDVRMFGYFSKSPCDVGVSKEKSTATCMDWVSRQESTN